MLKVDDIRQTRVYREAQEEGRQEGQELERTRQAQRDRQAVAKLAALDIAPERIAGILQLDIDFVRKELARK